MNATGEKRERVFNLQRCDDRDNLVLGFGMLGFPIVANEENDRRSPRYFYPEVTLAMIISLMTNKLPVIGYIL